VVGVLLLEVVVHLLDEVFELLFAAFPLLRGCAGSEGERHGDGHGHRTQEALASHVISSDLDRSRSSVSG
jgi:hypothetical protein